MPNTPSETPNFVPRKPSMSPSPSKKVTPDAQEHIEPIEPESKNQSKRGMEEMLDLYLASNPSARTDRKTNELEIRFGTVKPITRIDYDNVIKQLYAAGFVAENETGYTYLRIQSEYLDKRTGTTKISNIRAEIVGLDMVQEYCKTNSIQKLIDMPSYLTVNYDKIKFTQKSPPRKDDGKGDIFKPIDMKDFNFRMSYQLETDYSVHSNVVKNIMGDWLNTKKIFRYMNRVRFSHPVYPIFVDISIVKSSKKANRIPIPQYTIQDAGVFTNPEGYEIELELNNREIGIGTQYNSVPHLLADLRKVIRIVLSGLQGTYYPIAYSERSAVLQEYMKVCHGESYESRWVKNSDFIGPSSYTLQLKNIAVPSEDSIIPNIRTGYTVTDKADGERKLLFIGETGKIYMIDTNMNVIFTGMMTKDKTVFNTVIDGEHIKYDKYGEYINLYAAFDIYFVNKTSVREWSFIETAEDVREAEKEGNTMDPLKFRLSMLNRVVSLLKPVFVMKSEDGPSALGCKFDIRCKQFYADDSVHTIFNGCAQILSKITDGAFIYNTDGLIFTPASMGVAGSRRGISGPLRKVTWEHSFKWKPPQYNTIDFLISVKKDKSGKDEIYHVFEDGLNLQKAIRQISQYKILELRVGFDRSKHGYLNPMEDVIQGRFPSPDDLDNSEPYQPVLFQPTAPYDPQACYCNIMISDNGIMMTHEGEVIDEDSIVEFSYDPEKQGSWKWVPLRVRYDKTAELRNGLKNYGNAYHVANGNWHSIHNPVTEEMITTGENIPTAMVDEDVYYNRENSDSHTVALRHFHNRFVKNRLISGVSNRGDTLIDYAVGKAGDLSKWVTSHLSFVFGIDISRDNLENHLDGACARYLNNRRQFRDMPHALFVQGNSSLNIRDGEALMGNKDKQIAAAVFGNGPKDRTLLGEGVYNQWGKGKEGFTISSCQFAIHYFFENLTTFHSFMRNLAECTRIGGYFIGTGYDGQTVFRRLEGLEEGKSIRVNRNGSKIYEITKMYRHTGFSADDTSLGYPINVYQETINKTAMEYLVHFEYLKAMMENYGFVLISKAEARAMNLPAGTGLFRDLFVEMENEVKTNPKTANEYGSALKMSEEEKTISFMNRYFVFRKKYSVDAKKIFKQFVSRTEYEREKEKTETTKVRKYKIVKLKVPKFVIETYTPVQFGEMEPAPQPEHFDE